MTALPLTAPPVIVLAYGTPVPQGSKRTLIHKHSGRPVTIESGHDRLVPWREAVKHAALTVRADQQPLTGPLAVRMIFTFRRPQSHYRTGRNNHLLRDTAPVWPDRKPDLSKLARSTEDAIVDAGLITDDALIVEYARLAKVYVAADAEALDTPGVRIAIAPARRWAALSKVDWP